MKFVSDVKDELEIQLPKLKTSLKIITGFVTKEAFDFVNEIIEDINIEKWILFKLNLLDFQKGSSSFDFKKAIETGWKVYVDNSVHAKNYIFDENKYLQGSANLTSKGIGLHIENSDENCTLLKYNNDTRIWVENKFNDSLEINENNMEQVQRYIDEVINIEDKDILFKKQKSLEKRINKEHYNFEIDENYKKFNNIYLLDRIEVFKEVLQNNNITLEITYENLINIYKFKPNSSLVKEYIIDLDKIVKYDKFNVNNKMYSYTPKIYKYKNKYFLENVDYYCKNKINSKELKIINESLKYLYKKGICVNFDEDKMYFRRYKEVPYYKNFYSLENIQKELLEQYYIGKLQKLTEVNVHNKIKSFRLEE
ncbi:hypothetical protein [Tepidibacter hydrothermalis]|uniref:PLD phosphodiesterase domain-containing protein n=1 Tax=Tepidibacter hydrothermalis TaxID=3036126 RepID=A0ABY8EEV4_9FIRM|nr:hypothetical protein [Tepidibacter hydrothermalis]WFD11311.1 hypothetical protein P4S50_04335 [Tepidibacter hydrothermalis]